MGIRRRVEGMTMRGQEESKTCKEQENESVRWRGGDRQNLKHIDGEVTALGLCDFEGHERDLEVGNYQLQTWITVRRIGSGLSFVTYYFLKKSFVDLPHSNSLWTPRTRTQGLWAGLLHWRRTLAIASTSSGRARGVWHTLERNKLTSREDGINKFQTDAYVATHVRSTTHTGCNGIGQDTTTVTSWIRWNWTTTVFQRHACSDECNASDHFPRFRRICWHLVCDEHRSSFPIVHRRVELSSSSKMIMFLQGTKFPQQVFTRPELSPKHVRTFHLPLWPSFKQDGPTTRDSAPK